MWLVGQTVVGYLFGRRKAESWFVLWKEIGMWLTVSSLIRIYQCLLAAVSKTTSRCGPRRQLRELRCLTTSKWYALLFHLLWWWLNTVLKILCVFPAAQEKAKGMDVSCIFTTGAVSATLLSTEQKQIQWRQRRRRSFFILHWKRTSWSYPQLQWWWWTCVWWWWRWR